MSKKILLAILCFVAIFSIIACAPDSTAASTEPIVSTILPTEELLNTEPVHLHEYVSVVVQPLCNSAGYTKHICSCGDSYIDAETEMLGHVYNVENVEMSCETDGYTINTCEVCGHSFKENIIKSTGHQYEKKTIKASYTKKGYDLYTCSVCKNEYKDNYMDVIPHEHDYKSKEFAATCDKGGYIKYTCSLCNKSYKDKKVKALGHDYRTETILPTQQDGGYDIHVCSRCGDTYKDNYTDKLPHEHKYISTVTNPTCKNGGYTSYVCEICGNDYKDSETSALGHDYQTETILPTQQDGGYDVHVCSRCGDTYKDNYTDKLPHEHKYISTVTNPTCKNGGYTSYICETCGNSYKDSETSALGHDYQTETIKPTAQEKGYDVHKCSRCGDTYKDNYTDTVITYTEVNEIVYAISKVNIRKGPGTNYDKLGSLDNGESITRIGIGDNGWSKVMHNDEVAYMKSSHLSTEKPPAISSKGYPIIYSDSTATIVIYREWYENAWVYAAHLKFTDYSRLGTACANGKYGGGYERVLSASRRLGAVFAVNGCYSAPKLDYTVVRSGVICNGGDRNCWVPGVYSSKTGVFRASNGGNVTELVNSGQLTDTFCFGPQILSNGAVVNCNDSSRAQRTFMGTNGSAGDIWVCVSDGRYNDGESSGLTYAQCARFLASKGCTFGIPLDGGGSSTMVFNGKVLNAAQEKQRAVVDFVYFK